MGVKLIKYKVNNKELWGVINKSNKIIPLSTEYQTTKDVLQFELDTIMQLEEHNNQVNTIDLDTVEILSPLTWPSKIICQGANYSSHREEVGMNNQRPPFNMFFNKDIGSVIGPYDLIKKPKHVQLLDYEIELGLIIRCNITKPQHVTDENLHQYICGIVIFNDISARDVQLLQGQWLKGKSYRTFGPCGPYIYLLDKNEYELINKLELTLLVNDKIRQQANTEQLLYKPAETIQELSEIMELYTGDLIITGTTGGVALKMEPDILHNILNPVIPYSEKEKLLINSQKSNSYLKDGDIVTCLIKSKDESIDLGSLRNKVVF